ncbi:hypothetical protein PN497_19580 [Sphaerospermopsis kisseleviana CS-549]|uniref:Uncharacterized protein n=1 Tax=Sphaerospermopsis kisseleviana CS-549 TaxID=3021783 RepID=A0ABT4ZVT9_9CYAN|nr:hypothetical protein [Sphaerospermopsis kisseleviana]MDB9443538.1 hypothetical protein [Sphaerospermopsis kisseleviana CS-549]BAZ80689.1 hypothetical protein NIES73_19520 [Sphaerospermopsis kisseleviana NIES-73]
MNNDEKSALLAELAQLGIKHNSEKIVRIAKKADGKIVFLEEGNTQAGLQHILEEHSSQFADQGIGSDQIPDAIITAITEGKIIGYQGRKNTRIIYEVNFNSKTHYIAVTVSNNGYIVGANPRTSP